MKIMNNNENELSNNNNVFDFEKEIKKVEKILLMIIKKMKFIFRKNKNFLKFLLNMFYYNYFIILNRKFYKFNLKN